MNGIRMKMVRSSRARGERDAAFTRSELFACMVCVALIGAMALPVLATTRSRSDIAQCLNNLRQIGRAVRVWGNDQNDQPPWLTSASAGGTLPDAGGKPASAWFEYLLLSNQLAFPRILTCPADDAARIASDWSSVSNGLANPALRANAISYALGAHAFAEYPRAFLAADRNIQVTVVNDSCQPTRTTGIAGLRVLATPDPNIRWTNDVHKTGGHLLLNDGSVDYTDSAQLRAAISDPAADHYATLHIFKAR